jgi:hypothetical protein
LAEFANIMNSLEDLMTLIEALARDDVQNWKAVVETVMSFSKKNNTWILSKLPTNRKSIGCMWVFWIKKTDHGQIVHHKVRLVVKGYTWKHRVHFNDTFVPVVKFTSIRVLLAIVAI